MAERDDDVAGPGGTHVGVEGQLEAWADAASAASAASGAQAVSPTEAMAERSPASAHGRRRWARPLLGAAAALVVVVGAVAILRSFDDDAEPVTSGPTTPSTAAPVAGELELVPGEDFELLHLGSAIPPPSDPDERDPEQPFLRSASTQEELDDLWSSVRHLDPTRSSTPQQPTVDFDEQVVVSIAIPDDACPPDLVGFRGRPGGARGATTVLAPQFRETVDECEQPLLPKQYVVAIDLDALPDRFSVLVDGGNLSGDPAKPSGDGRSATLDFDQGRLQPLVVDLHLPTTTVEAGGEIEGTVTISNHSGRDATAEGCGAPFTVGLQGAAGTPVEDVRQMIAVNACLETFTVPPGTTSFDVTVSAGYLGCVSGPAQGAYPSCLEGGALPPMPAGEYRTFLQSADGFPDDAPPLTVTIT